MTAAAGDRLGSFDQGPTTTRQAQPGKGYTLTVRVLRILLPVAALTIVGILIARLNQGPNKDVLTVKTVKTTAGQIELVKPRYEGVDSKDRPYTLTADKAARDPNNPDVVILSNPVADIALQKKVWLAAKAAKGTYNHATQKLVLSGGVSLFHDAGYELDTDSIDVNIKQGRATATTPVSAHGPLGKLAARGMTATKAGDHIVFTGPAKMTIYHLRATQPERGNK